jgi:hypothetical protein
MAESKLSSVLPNNSIIDVMPGRPISTVYANNDNLLKPLELVQYNNDIEMSFSSKNFGDTNTFMFPRTYNFLKNISINLQIRFTANAALTIKEDYLVYHMIKEIKWTLGGTETLTLKGESLMHILMAQCESQEKKDRLLDLAGCAMPASDKGAKGTRRFMGILPLPWCSVESKKINHSQYPLPLHMLNQPLELQITFRSKAECFNIAAGGDADISSAVLNFEYAKIASPNQLKNTVYKYPFISNFGFTYNVEGTSPDVSIDLNSFRKGELKGISFTYVPSVLIDGNNGNGYYSGRKVEKVKLTFNGQTIWNAPKNELYELIYGKTFGVLGRRRIATVAEAASNKFYQTLVNNEIVDENALAELAPTTANDLIITRSEVISVTADNLSGKYSDKYYYYIPLSEIKDFSQNYILGVDASKQTLKLEFTRPDIVTKGKVFATYHYSACYQFDGDNAILIF